MSTTDIQHKMSKDSNNRKAKKSKKNQEVSKPKRPMSAYNFFFQAQRVQIVEDAKSRDETVTFDDIGRTIGERWRIVKEDKEKLAKYKVLAEADSVRYKTDMQQFYKDELDSLRLTEAEEAAAAAARNADSTAFLNAQSLESGTSGNLMNLQQQQTLAGLNTAPVSTASSSNLQAANGTTIMSQDEQVMQYVLQAQQNAPMTFNESILQLIRAQKASLQQRRQERIQELNSLQIKEELFDSFEAKELLKAQQLQQQQAGVPQGVVGQPSMAQQLAQLLQTTTGNNNTGALLPVANQAQAPASSLAALLGSSNNV